MASQKSKEPEPCTEDGWVTDRVVIHTVCLLRGFQDGDLIRLTRVQDYSHVKAYDEFEGCIGVVAFHYAGVRASRDDGYGWGRHYTEEPPVIVNVTSKHNAQYRFWIAEESIAAWKPMTKKGG